MICRDRLSRCRVRPAAAHFATRPFSGWTYGVVLLVFAAGIQHCRAQQRDVALPTVLQNHLYQLPSAATAQGTLKQSTQFQFRSIPLASAVDNIARAYRITIWLDRRIDPGYLLTYQARGTDLETALQQIARLAKAEMLLIENVVYIGPASCGPRIAIAAANLFDAMHRQNHASADRALPLSWDTLTTPTELLRSTAMTCQLSWGGELPHDLLRAGEFQRPSNMATCLALISGSHEQMCTVDGVATIQCEPLTGASRWTGQYATSSISAPQLQRMQRELPAIEARRDGDNWLITGGPSVHRSIGSGGSAAGGAQAGRRKPRGGRNAETRLSGDIAGSVENVAKQLAKMRGLEVAWDAECSEAQRQNLVSFHVDNATFEQIVEQFSSVAGLRIELSEMKMSFAP